MSYMSSALSDGPIITREGDRLIAVSSLWTQVLALGSWGRRVSVDPHQQTIEIEDRTFWASRSSRTILFRDVTAIGYGYRDTNDLGALSLVLNEGRPRRVEDRFSVGLKLAPNGQYTELFAFAGSGGRSYDFSLLDDWDWPGRNGWFAGDQDERSRQFANLLASIIGRKVVPA